MGNPLDHKGLHMEKDGTCESIHMLFHGPAWWVGKCEIVFLFMILSEKVLKKSEESIQLGASFHLENLEEMNPFWLVFFVWVAQIPIWCCEKPRKGWKIMFDIFLGNRSEWRSSLQVTLASWGTTRIPYNFSQPRKAQESCKWHTGDPPWN